MKIKNIIYAFILIVTFSSCSDWLSVHPKTELPVEVQFSSEQGFKDALAGVYILMKSPRLYGGALSYGNIDYMASLWDTDAVNATAEYNLAIHKYSDEKATEVMDNMYAKQYNVIVNINSILDNIEKFKHVFKTAGMYQTIKGECLALRAFMHLDLMRIYGPIPSEPDGAGSKLAYVKEVSKDINIPKSFDEYKEELFKDLNEAETLLKDIDPLLTSTVSSNKTTNMVSDFYTYRIIRMNYYAIKALQARAYLWYGDKNGAYNAAIEVINSTNTSGTKKFTLGSSSDFVLKNYVLPSEHIFCLHDYSLYSKFTNSFKSGILKKGNSTTTIKSTLFGNTGTDIRELNLWEMTTQTNGVSCHIIRKYQVPESVSSIGSDYRQIPLIRLSEMYMIAIETGINQQTLWNEFRASRGIPSKTLPTDETLLKKEILTEFRKEFYAEGQLFYLYKRYKSPKTDILFSSSSLVVNYIVPLPISELSK